MRRQFVVLALGGFALSTSIGASPSVRDKSDEVLTRASATVAVQQVDPPLSGMRDEAAMVLVGSALIGLAAAVRRAA